MACQTLREEDYGPAGKILAMLESAPQTRTTLSQTPEGVSRVLWSEGDQIAVFMDGSSGYKTFTLTDGAGTMEAQFSGEGAAQNYIAFYPVKMVSSLNEDNIRIILPAEQKYREGSFDDMTFPMIASGNTSQLQFYNLVSVLRLPITGNHPVTRIVFRSAQNSIKVCGQATARVSSHQLSMTSDGRDSLVLRVGNVQLKESEATPFYLVLPPQTYKGGFSVRVYSGERYMDKAYAKDFTMERSQQHKADAFAFTPNSVDDDSPLEGSGTESDPFLIGDLEDILYMQQAVNAGSSIRRVEARKAAYKLMADIDLSPECSEDQNKNWTPVGSTSHAFQGHFDGNRHKLSGLFIKSDSNNQALFGYVDGAVICNLSVDGKVESSSDAVALIVAGGQNSTVDNCMTEGSVSGKRYTGGIIGQGERLQMISRCVNHAEVSGDTYVGGIVGITYMPVFECVNHGAVSGTINVGGIGGCTNAVVNSSNYGAVTGTSHRVGGVSGNHNAGVLANCQNFGAVSSQLEVGGITGYSRQRASVWNNINRGCVSGNRRVGGVCGYLSSNSSVEFPSTLQNCVNLGTVNNGQPGNEVGSLVGFNAGEDTEYRFQASEISQSYWLWDSFRNIGMSQGIGLDEGKSSSLFSLTEREMKGGACSVVLFDAYNTVLDALNAWSFRHKNYYSLSPLWGWSVNQDDGYPTLTGLEAAGPGDNISVFKVTPSDILLESPKGEECTVEVTSTSEYEVSVPEWMTMGDVVGFETNRYVKIHHFIADANEGKASRSGEIVFTNAERKVLRVRVKQACANLTVDATELQFPENGGPRYFNITSSLSWTVSSDADWCSVEPEAGKGDSKITVRATANENASARTCMLTVLSEDWSFMYTIPVVQSGKKPNGGGSNEDWKELPFVHQSVAMRFTATWCGWCPRMNKTIKRAQELYPDKIQHLALHGGGSDLQFDSVGALMDLYGISGFPTGVVDGRKQVQNGEIESTAQSIVQIVKETETTYGTASGVDINSSVSGRKAFVSVGVYLKKAGNYKITVLLVEDGIVNPQTDYEEGDHPKYIHDCVARIAMSNVLGDAFNAAADFSEKHFDYSVDVPDGYNMANMRVLVYIQRALGNYFIDNCATIELGGSLLLALEGGTGGGGSGGDDNEGIKPGDDINL